MTCRRSSPAPGNRPAPAILLLLGLLSAAPCPGPPDPVATTVTMRICWRASDFSADAEMVATVGRISRATDGTDIWVVLVPIGEGRAPAAAGELTGRVPWPTVPEPCWDPATQSVTTCAPSRVLYVTDLRACSADGCCAPVWGAAEAARAAAAMAP